MDDNVVKFPGVEQIEYNELEEMFNQDVELKSVFDAAIEKDFDDVIIIGTYNDKANTYFASSSPDPAKIVWDLERAKFMLMSSFIEVASNPYDSDEDE